VQRQTKLVLSGLAMAGAAALVIYVLVNVPKPVDQAPSPPPPFRFDAQAVVKRAAERVAIVRPSASLGGLTPTAAYAAVQIAVRNADAVAAVVHDLHGDVPAGFIVAARVTLTDGRKLPSLPILIGVHTPPTALPEAVKTKDDKVSSPTPPSIKALFVLGGRDVHVPLTPWFRFDGVSKVMLALDVAYVAEALAVDAAAVAKTVIAALGTETVWSAADRDAPKTMGAVAEKASSFMARFFDPASERANGFVTFDLEMPEGAGRVLTFGTGVDTAQAVFQIAGRPPLLAGGTDNDYHTFAARAVSGQTLATFLGKHADITSVVLTAEADRLASACRALADTLSTRLGLASVDVTAVLTVLIRLRALFTASPEAPCLEGVSLPASKERKSSTRLNAILDRIAASIRQLPADQTQARLVDLFAPRPALFDFGRLWLVADATEIVGGPSAYILPAGDAMSAAGHLAALPIVRMGCYSDGTGIGVHRAALVELRHDRGLWVLDVAFDDAGKIHGLALAEARQSDMCRAVRGRPNCAFAAAGKAYHGLDPGRC
jgi:hypothetical protein